MGSLPTTVLLTAARAFLVCAGLGGAAMEASEPRASLGCRHSQVTPAGETVVRSLEVGPLVREYRLRLPEGHDPSTPAPLVLVFHGYTDSAQGVEETVRSFRVRADRLGAVLVYPQATHFQGPDGPITSWNDLACNASPGPEGPTCTASAHDYPTPPECGEPRECDWCTCHDDLAFVRALLDELESTLCLDLDRFFATGMSNGAMFVHRLGCELPDRFAALVPVAGTLARGSICAPPPSSPVAMMNVSGTGDTLVPADGSPGHDGFLYVPSERVMDAWAESQGCAGGPSPYSAPPEGVPGLRCVERARCQTGAEIVDCVWEGGHDWPRTKSGDVAAELIWDFFERNGPGPLER